MKNPVMTPKRSPWETREKDTKDELEIYEKESISLNAKVRTIHRQIHGRKAGNSSAFEPFLPHSNSSLSLKASFIGESGLDESLTVPVQKYLDVLNKDIEFLNDRLLTKEQLVIEKTQENLILFEALRNADLKSSVVSEPPMCFCTKTCTVF